MPRLVVCLAVAVLASSTRADGPVERGPAPHRVDLNGDPLPDGAVARLARATVGRMTRLPAK